MVTVKGFVILIVMAFAVVFTAAGQAREMSAEDAYLQETESFESRLIRETSRADTREQALIALQYIREAVKDGNKGNTVLEALRHLALQGLIFKNVREGRVHNNFPDVRRDVAKCLGDVGTLEAKDILIKMCITDNEPMVLQEVVKSLGKIGFNGNNETVGAIYWTLRRFDTLNPDNLLTLVAIDAFSKIAEKNNGIDDPNLLWFLFYVSDSPNYIKPVQNRAKQAIAELRKY